MKRAPKMKSPFPGVDPYLEQYWGDIHTSLMVYIRDQISDQLPRDLQARVEESVCVDVDKSPRRIYPDVVVIELPEFASPLRTQSSLNPPLFRSQANIRRRGISK